MKNFRIMLQKHVHDYVDPLCSSGHCRSRREEPGTKKKTSLAAGYFNQQEHS
jgi:hypothetical protein